MPATLDERMDFLTKITAGSHPRRYRITVPGDPGRQAIIKARQPNVFTAYQLPDLTRDSLPTHTDSIPDPTTTNLDGVRTYKSIREHIRRLRLWLLPGTVVVQ